MIFSELGTKDDEHYHKNSTTYYSGRPETMAGYPNNQTTNPKQSFG